MEIEMKQTLYRHVKYFPYRMEIALNVVTQLGKQITPDFVIDKSNEFLYKNLIKWVHNDVSMLCTHPDTSQPMCGRLNKGIYIAGGIGTGKSCALEIMSKYSQIDDVKLMIGGVEKNLSWRNIRTDDVCAAYEEHGTITEFKSEPIIGFQDLGSKSEPRESVNMGNRIPVMAQILCSRGDANNKITLITSNFPMKHKNIMDRYDEPVVSRLVNMCNYFELKGIDRRTIFYLKSVK